MRRDKLSQIFVTIGLLLISLSLVMAKALIELAAAILIFASVAIPIVQRFWSYASQSGRKRNLFSAVVNSLAMCTLATSLILMKCNVRSGVTSLILITILLQLAAFVIDDMPLRRLDIALLVACVAGLTSVITLSSASEVAMYQQLATLKEVFSHQETPTPTPPINH